MTIIRKRKKLLAVLLALVLLLGGCYIRYTPPSVRAAVVFLSWHRKDIDTVVDYMKELECDFAFVKNMGGKIFYEHDWHDIESKAVKASIRRLWFFGCREIIKDDEQGANTISFMIWHRTMGSVDCGIACTIDGQGAPKTLFQISREEIGDGWYYYFDDYEEWRKYPAKYEEYQP